MYVLSSLFSTPARSLWLVGILGKQICVCGLAAVINSPYPAGAPGRGIVFTTFFSCFRCLLLSHVRTRGRRPLLDYNTPLCASLCRYFLCLGCVRGCTIIKVVRNHIFGRAKRCGRAGKVRAGDSAEEDKLLYSHYRAHAVNHDETVSIDVGRERKCCFPARFVMCVCACVCCASSGA